MTEINRLTLLTAALALLPCALGAQELGTVSYALPSTTVTLKVEAVKETFFAGPYARYAKKYLGIDARQKDGTTCYITAIDLVPCVEADQGRRYSVNITRGSESFLAMSAQGLVAFGQTASTDDVSWKFASLSRADFSTKAVTSALVNSSTTLYRNVRTDSSYSRVAVQQSVVVEKTLEQRAQEAAGMILKIRSEKFNITIGNTDATFSGEALGAAINELTRLEEEYMTMFIGYSETQVQKMDFDVIPVRGRANQLYVAFRISDTEGLVSPDNFSGKPYYLEFAPEALSRAEGEEKPSGKSKVIYYRVPVVCTVKLTDGARQLMQTRIPVYQLGEEGIYPL